MVSSSCGVSSRDSPEATSTRSIEVSVLLRKSRASSCRPSRRPSGREGVHRVAEQLTDVAVPIAEADVHVGRHAGVGRERQEAAVRRPALGADEMLDLRRLSPLLGPPAVGRERVDLVELVPVLVGGERRSSCRRRGRDRPDRVRLESGQLLGGPPGRGPPKVELAGRVRDEQEPAAVRRELERRLESADREELLEPWRNAPWPRHRGILRLDRGGGWER